MSKEDLSNIHAGNSRKYELEGGKDEVSTFVERLGLKDSVRLQRASSNGFIKWDGGRFDGGLDALDEKSVINAKGSGCLEIVDGSCRTVIFMSHGEIIRKHREQYKGAMQGVDPRQSRMNI